MILLPLLTLMSLGMILTLGKFCGLVTLHWYWVLSPYLAGVGLALVGTILADAQAERQWKRASGFKTFRVLSPA